MEKSSLSIWNQWKDFHTLPDQIKRQKSAADKKLTPVQINTQDYTGVFKGSNGQYNTSLSGCSCTDFSRRKQPCKHMYRLAYELGIFHLSTPVSESAVPLTKSEALSLITSALTKDEQIQFKDFCYVCGNDNAGEDLLPAPFADKLIRLNLAMEVTDPKILLKHLPMNTVRKFLPPGTKSPRTKIELISLVAPNVDRKKIIFPNGDKCVTLHASISHLGHTLHRRLCDLYPNTDFIS